MARVAKLNVQALARKDERLMRSLLAPPGMIAVSNDLAAGEPSCIAHFSKDKNYYDATLGMVGKEPFYDGEVLRIGSIYAMVASVSPIGKARMREIFSATYDGVPFPVAFTRNPDLVKDSDPKFYALHKILTLGLGYSMGPRKLVTQAYDSGHIIDFKTAKEFYNQYWALFGDVQKLAKLLEAKFTRDKYLINPFGYRLKPDKPYKALNYFIQSSVSGIMHILCAKYFAVCPWAEFVTIIHDELVQFVPIDRLEEAKAGMKQAEASLNADLKWSVNIRVGWAEGKDLYEAK
jgi:hypothetical protein